MTSVRITNLLLTVSPNLHRVIHSKRCAFRSLRRFRSAPTIAGHLGRRLHSPVHPLLFDGGTGFFVSPPVNN